MSTDRLQPYDAELPEPDGTYCGSDQRGYASGQYTAEKIRSILADAHAHYEAQVRQLGGLARPDEQEQRRVYLVATGAVHEGQETYTRHEGGPPPLCDSECLYSSPQPAVDAACPVVAWRYTETGPHARMPAAYLSFEAATNAAELFGGRNEALVYQRDYLAAMAAKDARIAGLEADLTEERNRIASMRAEFGEEAAELTARARHAEDVADAAKERIANMRLEFGIEVDALVEARRVASKQAVNANLMSSPCTSRDRFVLSHLRHLHAVLSAGQAGAAIDPDLAELEEKLAALEARALAAEIDARRYRRIRSDREFQKKDGTLIDVFDEDGALLFDRQLDEAIDAMHEAEAQQQEQKHG